MAAQQKRTARGLLKPGRKRKYPILVGPPRPKINQKYDKATDIGQWIYRSKTNKKASLRKELSVEDYKKLIVSNCPLLGIELSYKNYTGNAPNNYATLDKIDPTKGYIPGNVQILSYRANTLKNSATLEELKTIVKNWENHLKKNAVTL